MLGYWSSHFHWAVSITVFFFHNFTIKINVPKLSFSAIIEHQSNLKTAEQILTQKQGVIDALWRCVDQLHMKLESYNHDLGLYERDSGVGHCTTSASEDDDDF